MDGSPSRPSARPAVAPYQIIRTLRDLFSKSQGAENKKQVRHQNENDEILPVFEEICAAQNDGAHERDKVGRGKECAKRIKNPWHRLTWKNETGKENARQQKLHRHLKR